MKKAHRIRIFLLTILFMASNFEADAKKYLFDIESERIVIVNRSTAAGTKMVRVTAYGRSADAAIEQAKIDAVAALTFDGAKGQGEMEGCPAVVYGGREAYYQNRDFFDKFFKKGDFLPFVEKVNNSYPLGEDNVKTSRGRRINILLIVDWKGLADYFKKAGVRTIVSELGNL